jgi:4-aminobutyrate aminotransferase-like enzyme
METSEDARVGTRARPVPSVRTEVPGPKSLEWIEREQHAETGGNAYPDFFGMGVHAPVFVGEQGSLLVDIDGNSFVETSGCYSCGTFGYLPAELIEVAVDNTRRLVHVPDVPTPQRVEAAEAILSIAPGRLRNGRVQFELGGAGAMDLAYQMAFYYAASTKPFSNHIAVAFGGSYHGRSVATLSLTGSTHAQERMPRIANNVVRFPFPYCYRCPYDKRREDCDLFCVTFMRRQFETDAFGLFNPRTGICQASVMLWEPIQAHIGMVFPPDEFFGEMRRLCDDYGLVLVDDEIAMGVGHTGEWFAAQSYGTVPDIVVLAKALTGGVWPLGAVIASDEISATWGATPDKHMGSYHGNPVGCAVAAKNIQLLKERNVLENVREQAVYANERLDDLSAHHPLVGESRAVGLAIGIELVGDRETREPAPDATLRLAKECMRRGLLVLRLGYFGNRLNMMPSLDSSHAELEFIFDTIDEALTATEREG